jgi:hypothetical protein
MSLLKSHDPMSSPKFTLSSMCYQTLSYRIMAITRSKTRELARLSGRKPTLSTFPAEILYHILTFLCLHCTGTLDARIFYTPVNGEASYGTLYSWPHIHALYAACLVSTRFCAIAQPILYHDFTLSYPAGYGYKDWKRLGQFLRTGKKHPRIAHMVREIHMVASPLHGTKPITSLQQFPHLRQVTLESSFVYTYLISEELEDDKRLVRLLPHSLVTFQIYETILTRYFGAHERPEGESTNKRLSQSLLVLADAVSRGGFPCLRAVILKYDESRPRTPSQDLITKFATVGVLLKMVKL